VQNKNTRVAVRWPSDVYRDVKAMIRRHPKAFSVSTGRSLAIDLIN
jgi:hypothetical protein